MQYIYIYIYIYHQKLRGKEREIIFLWRKIMHIMEKRMPNLYKKDNNKKKQNKGIDEEWY